MPRLPLARTEELKTDPALRVWGSTFRGLYGHAPEALRALGPLYLPLVMGDSGRLERRLLEIARLRVAAYSGCIACREGRMVSNDGARLLDDEMVAKLGNFENEDFTEQEKLTIHFVDRMATDHMSVDDEFFAELRSVFSDDQVVELAMAITFMLGLSRLNVVLGMNEIVLQQQAQQAETVSV